MKESSPPPEAELRRLWATLARLLAPDGCPWDREQDAPALARHLIEEGHEWLEAAETGSAAEQAEEIGDLAYLVVFGLQAIERDEGIAPGTVVAGIDAKLRRRHPHLFDAAVAGEKPDGDAGRAPADSAAQLKVWERVKRAERGDDAGLLKPLPRSLGALARSQRYQEQAAGVGFDWPDLAGVLAKLDEELGELRHELEALPAETPGGEGRPSGRYRAGLAGRDRGRLRDELGDLLFVVVNLCRWLGLDAEEVAEGANAKFLRRFGAMEASLRAEGGDIERSDLEEMERHWRRAKAAEPQEP